MIDRETVELAERNAKDSVAFDAHRKATTDFRAKAQMRLLEDERAIAAMSERGQVLGAALKRSREALLRLEAEIPQEIKALESARAAEQAAIRDLDEAQRRAGGAALAVKRHRTAGADPRVMAAAEKSEKELAKLLEAAKAKLAAAADAVKRAEKARATALERVRKSVAATPKT